MLKLISQRLNITKLTNSTVFKVTQEKLIEQELSRRMNNKVEVMKEGIAKTTPRAFSLLFLGAALPAFFFINELIES